MIKGVLRTICITTILLIIFSFSSSINTFATPLEEKADPRIIRVGWHPQAHIQQESSNQLKIGLNYEYLMEMAKYGGWTYEYVPGTFEECLQMLKEGKIDLLGDVFYTSEQATQIDFSNRFVSSSYPVLAVHETNETYFFEDFENFNELHIGVLKNTPATTWLSDYAAQHTFTYTQEDYDSTEALLNALETKDIDAILINDFSLTQGSGKIIAQLTPIESYFAVQKGNNELLFAVNSALSHIDENTPLFRLLLEQKYMRNRTERMVAFTREEAQCLQSYDTIRITLASFRKPMMYRENGQYHGIAIDIIKKIEQKLGVSIEFVEAANQLDAIAFVKEGKADLMSNVYHDWGWSESQGFLLSKPYLDLDYAAIVRVGESPNNPAFTVAAVKGYLFSDNYIRTHYPKSQIFWYDSEDACVDAVLKGRQDICFTSTYVATTYIQDYRYQGLYASPINFSHGLAFGIPLGEKQALLLSAIDKTITSLAPKTTSIIAANTMYDHSSMSFAEMMARHPLAFILLFGVVIVLFFALVTGFSIWYNNRRNNIEISRARLESQKDSLTNLYNRLSYELMTIAEIQRLRSGSHCAFVMLDIDHFKQVNDTHGHNYGDQMLVALANAMQELLGHNSLLCRMGGDEFSAFFPNITSRQELAKQLEHFQEMLSNGTLPDEMCIFCSIGVAIGPEAGTSFEDMYANADQALYNVKRNRKGKLCFF